MARGLREATFHCHKASVDAGWYTDRETGERKMRNLGADRRQAGLEMMVGNAAIAHALGPNEDIATTFNGPHDAFVCGTCAADEHLILLRICDRGAEPHG